MHNKKAQFGKQIMIFPFVFLLIIIALGISAGVVIYFGTGYDFRALDASLLSYKIEKCVLENSDLNKLKDNFYETCRLNKESLEKNKFFFKVCRDLNAIDCANTEDDKNILVSLGSNFQPCFFEGVKENKAYAKCHNLDLLKDGAQISIITGSNQQIRRIST